METKLKAKQIGGSIGLIIPREIVEIERISANDILKVKIEKTGDLSFLWGKLKDVKKSTDKIMEEIDEWENG
ncbi:hypothetical protein J4466_00505 [Candidatus Pacearchaeota archaeon]|nr:hypothetical protein [Candidatus Pacearchaeota archaeon]